VTWNKGVVDDGGAYTAILIVVKVAAAQTYGCDGKQDLAGFPFP
jgi:hypothetical protein